MTSLSGQGGKVFSERSCKLKFGLHLLRAVPKRPVSSRQVVNFSFRPSRQAGSYCSQIELVHYQHLAALHLACQQRAHWPAGRQASWRHRRRLETRGCQRAAGRPSLTDWTCLKLPVDAEGRANMSACLRQRQRERERESKLEWPRRRLRRAKKERK